MILLLYIHIYISYISSLEIIDFFLAKHLFRWVANLAPKVHFQSAFSDWLENGSIWRIILLKKGDQRLSIRLLNNELIAEYWEYAFLSYSAQYMNGDGEDRHLVHRKWDGCGLHMTKMCSPRLELYYSLIKTKLTMEHPPCVVDLRVEIGSFFCQLIFFTRNHPT